MIVAFVHEGRARPSHQERGCALCCQLRAQASIISGALNLLINMADTNSMTQDALSLPEAAAALHTLLDARGYARILSSTCLLISHISWNHPTNQRLFGTESAVSRLLSFLSPGGRAAVQGSHWADGTSSPPVTPAEAQTDGAQAGIELTLYALMALVNLSYRNQQVQELVRKCGGMPTLLQQLLSPAYDVKKSASFCLGNLVLDNTPNKHELVLHGGIELLLHCINDEDDDELSKTAYATIAQVGEPGLFKLMELIGDAVATLQSEGPLELGSPRVSGKGFLHTSLDAAGVDFAPGEDEEMVPIGMLPLILGEPILHHPLPALLLAPH